MIRLLRTEAAVLALLLALGLWRLGPPWWLAVLVLAAPDLTFLGYRAGPRMGAAIYNAAHAAIGPALLALSGLLLPSHPLIVQVAGLWGLHIAIDRALGFGLKLPTGFGDTHLGRLGR